MKKHDGKNKPAGGGHIEDWGEDSLSREKRQCMQRPKVGECVAVGTQSPAG